MTENKQERGQWTSASNAEADLRCPGRHLAQKNIAEPQETGEQAEWRKVGETLHDALRLQSPTGLNAAQSELYDRCNHIDDVLLLRFFGEESFSSGMPHDQIKATREQRYWAGAGDIKHSGQADVVWRRGPKVLISDYKSLRGEQVESPKNMQLRDLAVLVWLGTPLVKEIGVFINQPYATMHPELCVYDEAALKQALAEMQARVLKSNDPKSPRIPGDVQCNYCRAKSQCPEYQQWAGSKVPVPVSILDVPVAQWTPEQRAIFCDNKKRAQQWLDECEAEMKRLLTADPTAIPGWTLEPGTVKHPINNAQSCYERCSKHGVSLEAFMKCINVKKTDLKDAVKTASGLKGKAMTAAWELIEDGITDTKQDAPSLKKEAK
jgi:hypothetical protein